MKGGIIMNVTETAAAAAMELSDTLKEMDSLQGEKLMDAICMAKKIYAAGAGRSLLALRCLAMRLMHLGFEAYVVGETITPAYTDKVEFTARKKPINGSRTYP